MLTDTITAIATASGYGGVGIIRISGQKTRAIGVELLTHFPKPRCAEFVSFYDSKKTIIDQGIAIFFPRPHSFTGEDVLELHAHGSPIVLNCLLHSVIKLGARLARAGEFSERAFLNNKLDLIQAEAIADLIQAGSEQAAKAAMQSLQGDFSHKITQMVDQLIHLRTYVEASMDFSEEEIDFLTVEHINQLLNQILQAIKNIKTVAKQGILLRDGIHLVIVGEPNTGKSSLLNLLSKRDSAIVSETPGTTRDVLREFIQIDGLPIHLTDTAGLRKTTNKIEKEGVYRALAEVKKADRILLVIDHFQTPVVNIKALIKSLFSLSIKESCFALIRNKIDLSQESPELTKEDGIDVIKLSAKTGAGYNILCEYLKNSMGFESYTGSFSARTRHIEALSKAEEILLQSKKQRDDKNTELFAEDLREAQKALEEITGKVTSEDLLTRIFSSFCVGK